MVGNTYPYSIDDWFDDITLAIEHDIDGFVLNVGHEQWQKDRVSDCFQAASRLHAEAPFSFFLSFDMSAVPSQTENDIVLLSGYLETFGLSLRMFRHHGKVMVSTFSGENGLFGQHSLELAYSFVKRTLEMVTPIHLVPSFFIDPARYPAFEALDGAFNWNGGWPLHLTSRSSRSHIENASLDTDQYHLKNLHGRTFMAAVSPWFFTHYGPDSWNKNWIYRGDDWLFVRRWEQLIEMRDQIDFVQVISWNDYGESHYIGPIKGAQPNSQAWVNGYPHTSWLVLNQYFARAFRTGKYPEIKTDRIFMWARPHAKNAIAKERVPRPEHWQLTDDVFWVVVFAAAACKVRLYSDHKHSKSFNVDAGMTRLSFPLRVGSGMRARMKRNGVVILDCHPHDFIFTNNPEVYNFNAFVTMAEN
ncbi:glycoside hydrolase family 71 protein [Collybia nuda]|uniref:Glycoside hydrolase family 71 protein n=1 Tax=Collybia nuda TaxID=64659 RepID=A0A9P5YDP8_9AGAR|nr:glycoside hydrolase family 71 protein [Collybia nuda]